jgi:hypothetical protein
MQKESISVIKGATFSNLRMEEFLSSLFFPRCNGMALYFLVISLLSKYEDLLVVREQ